MARPLRILALAALGAALTVGLGGFGGRASSQKQGPVNLTMWWWGEQEAAGAKKWLADTIRLYRKKHPNVTVVEGAAQTTNLTPACCDAILIRDAYHHLTEPDPIVKSLASALKPGGRLAVIDFPPRPKSDVPSGVPADRLGHGVPPEVVEREVGAALTHVRTLSAWSAQSEPASLFLVLFRKP